jgi:hypothetical protein
MVAVLKVYEKKTKHEDIRQRAAIANLMYASGRWKKGVSPKTFFNLLDPDKPRRDAPSRFHGNAIEQLKQFEEYKRERDARRNGGSMIQPLTPGDLS